MSDLQCPATFLLLPLDATDAAVAAPGREDGELVSRLVEALTGEHVAQVYAGPDEDQAALADRLAAALGAPRGALEDSADPRSLEDVADLHRGERLVVVLSAADLAALLHVVRRAPEAGRSPGGWTEVAVDADGWVLRAAP